MNVAWAIARMQEATERTVVKLGVEPLRVDSTDWDR
jgi:hypothetical protein